MFEFLLVIAVPILWGIWELVSLSRDAARRKRDAELPTEQR